MNKQYILTELDFANTPRDNRQRIYRLLNMKERSFRRCHEIHYYYKMGMA